MFVELTEWSTNTLRLINLDKVSWINLHTDQYIVFIYEDFEVFIKRDHLWEKYYASIKTS